MTDIWCHEKYDQYMLSTIGPVPAGIGHILLVKNYLILSLTSMKELSNFRPIKYVHWHMLG